MRTIKYNSTYHSLRLPDSEATEQHVVIQLQANLPFQPSQLALLEAIAPLVPSASDDHLLLLFLILFEAPLSLH